MTENTGRQPTGTSVMCLFFAKSFTLVANVYPYSGKDFIDFSGNSDCTRNAEFFHPVNRGSLELQPAHNKPLKQFRPIILIHCEQNFSISQLTINIGSPPSPIEIYGKTPSDFNRSCSRPWGFQRPDMQWFSTLHTRTTGQTFGFVKHK